jgi:S1-C subfamily serine protease
LDEAAPRPGAHLTDCLEEIAQRIVRIRSLTKVRIDPKAPQGLVYEYTYGTGELISADGLIATAYHLVRDRQKSILGAEEVAVLVRDAKNYVPVDVIAEDPASDVALLQVNPRALPERKYFSMERTSLPEPGERSYVVGLRAEAAADELELGIVAGRFLDARKRLEELAGEKKLGPGPWITISQMILMGYSGGAILDSSGHLVGIVGGAPELHGKWVELSYGTGVEAVMRLVEGRKKP